MCYIFIQFNALLKAFNELNTINKNTYDSVNITSSQYSLDQRERRLVQNEYTVVQFRSMCYLIHNK